MMAATVVPEGFTAVTQAPLHGVTNADMGRSLMAVVKLPKSRLSFQFGTIQRTFQGKNGKYAKLYNVDVIFAGQRGAVGMLLEVSGKITTYDANAQVDADEGTWFFVEKIPKD